MGTAPLFVCQSQQEQLQKITTAAHMYRDTQRNEQGTHTKHKKTTADNSLGSYDVCRYEASLSKNCEQNVQTRTSL